MTSTQTGLVQTVLGTLAPEDLGITIMHEHMLVDLACYFDMPEEASQRAWVDAPVTMDRLGKMMANWSHNHDTGQLWDVEVAIDEALKYRYAGGVSLVDATSLGLGRDPLALARISRATGLNIIMGGSYYVPVSHPADMDDRTEDELTEKIVRDVTLGVDDTGIKSGLIGEVGNFHPLSENERKVLRASARAQVETGAPIMIHPGIDDWSPHGILEILVESGADPRHIVFAHLGMAIWDMGAMTELAQAGCFMEFDHLGAYEDSSIRYMGEYNDSAVSDVQEMDKIEYLVDKGFGDQVVVSHDINFKHSLTKYGGKGIAHILDSIVPRLRRRGFEEGQIDALLVGNPRRALTLPARERRLRTPFPGSARPVVR
jgi:phosphotriesterase-related protein